MSILPYILILWGAICASGAMYLMDETNRRRLVPFLFVIGGPVSWALAIIYLGVRLAEWLVYQLRD